MCTERSLRTKNKQVSMVNRDYRSWIEPLDQVSQTTNINAFGIRNFIEEAIACEPPEWARALLLSGLGKDFPNAKEIISSVRARYYGKEFHINGTEKEERNKKNTGVPGNDLNIKDIDNKKTTISCPESVTECCRNAFHETLKKDEFGELFKLVHGISKGLLDFNLINIRMKVGTYGKSPELFSKDMQKVWDNIRSLGHKINLLTTTVQDFSGAAYQRQVFSSAGEEAGERDLICASKKIIQQSANKDSGREHPFSANQHHASKPNIESRRIPRPEKRNIRTINMKKNKQNERLTAVREAENVLQKEDLEKRGYHCIVCERLSRQMEPQDSGKVLESPSCGVLQSPVNGEQIGTYSDVNEKGLPSNKEEMEINQGEGTGGAETEVNTSMQQEKYRIVDDSTEGLHALDASMVVNASSMVVTGKNSQDHEMKIPQYQSHNGTQIARYCLASPERGVSSDENCGSKDNFRIFVRRKKKSKSGEDTDSTETGKSKRTCLEPR